MSQNLCKRSLGDFLSLRHSIDSSRPLLKQIWHTNRIFKLYVLSLIYAQVTRVRPRDFASGRNPCGGNYKLNLHCTIIGTAKKSVTINFYHGKLKFAIEPSLTRTVFCFPSEFELLGFYCTKQAQL